ncbi:hypothetical protein DFP72DRAFT_927148 [Ephemerocybe angulata]|uniref:Uncharacterized protein n=1 Tax=Ephemerocybe angulata TaxID=980116 RepID=A0A8H6HDK2_9AGAR|nr:hypothetical protein DFP72DRAFT_927148 [Tulosesus angulatus]
MDLESQTSSQEQHQDPTTSTSTAGTETPPPTANDLCDNIITDPPPPYPSGRARRARRQRRSHPTRHTQLSSIDTHSSISDDVHTAAEELHSPSSGSTDGEDDDGDEHAHFLAPNSISAGQMRNPALGHGAGQHRRRPRSISHASTMSAAPSLAQTVLSLFEQEDVDNDIPGDLGPIHLPDDGLDERHMESLTEDHDGTSLDYGRRNENGWRRTGGWKRYWRPLGRTRYWRALAHLLFVNFPYALAAWLYLFVFTVTGTTLLVALPLGALLCFLNLLGARTFARGELALQQTFHAPLSYPPPYPPRPIFTRYREATTLEIESGVLGTGRTGLVRERSFYKNSYAMFTDPTSYQALFYFIVIKPAITIILLLFILVFVIPCLVLVAPAPAALRAVRKLGRWQANVAVEGLYHAVR